MPVSPMPACPMLLILLISLGSLPASRQSYQDFQREHMDYPKTDPHLAYRVYCNLMMQRRGMTSVVCKEFNTFIHENTSAVDAICTSGGTNVGGNYYDSHAYFTLTNCKVIGGRGQRPPCSYNAWSENKRIEVACNRRSLPVHFQRRL